MAKYDYTAADVVKNVRARLRVIAATYTVWAEQFPDGTVSVVEAAQFMQAQIGNVGVDLDEHLSALGGDPLRYDNGSPVTAAARLTEDQQYVWVFDPRPDHPVNRPQVVAQDIPLVDGTSVDVVVAGGVLDVVRRRTPGLA
jgi:hypothetical protein